MNERLKHYVRVCVCIDAQALAYLLQNTRHAVRRLLPARPPGDQSINQSINQSGILDWRSLETKKKQNQPWFRRPVGTQMQLCASYQSCGET